MGERAESMGGGQPLSDKVRTRIRMQAAALDLTHEEIAQRMTQLGARTTSRAKVSEVIRGGPGTAKPKLDELRVWALALETNEAFLLGFTWDPRPEPGTPAIVDSDTPGRLNRVPHPSNVHPLHGATVIPFRGRPA